MDWGLFLFGVCAGAFLALIGFSLAEERPRKELLARVAELDAQNKWLWSLIEDWNRELDRREKPRAEAAADEAEESDEDLFAPELGENGAG